MSATKADHANYRAGVLAVAKPGMLSAADLDRHTVALDVAKLTLGIDSDTFAADVQAAREAERLRELVEAREALNLDLLAVHREAEAFEAAVVKERAALLDSRNQLLGKIQVADAAATKLTAIEKSNPRVYG